MLSENVKPRTVNSIVDTMTGYAINIPAEEQLPPGWWRNPETASHILAQRERLGIDLRDELWKWSKGQRAR